MTVYQKKSKRAKSFEKQADKKPKDLVLINKKKGN